ncbi:MAG: class I SAM-dependent methyltransferase [Myxococcota bacterium]
MNPELYDAHDRLEDRHWWFEGRRRVIREVMQRHLLPRAQRRILDVGCGTGGMFPLLSEFGEVDGAEAAPDALERARRKFPLRRIESCALPDQVPEGQWDVVTAFDVIEHLDEPIASLRTMRSRLPWDGQMVITVPAFQFLWSRHDEANHHRRRYSRLQLVSELSSAGLKVTFVSYFNTVLFPAVAGVRLLEKLLPSRVEAAGADLEETKEPINRLLTTIFGAERFAVGRTQLPFGVSLIAVAQKA